MFDLRLELALAASWLACSVPIALSKGYPPDGIEPFDLLARGIHRDNIDTPGHLRGESGPETKLDSPIIVRPEWFSKDISPFYSFTRLRPPGG